MILMSLRTLKAIAIVFVALVVFATVGILAVYVYARRSLPLLDGASVIAGARYADGTQPAPIEIIRDADAIPHVFAATRRDALFGLGYVHAQDRLWQMEFQRRIGHGRLSEIFGHATIPQDRFLRTVGFGRAARSAWNATPEWARRQIDAYVAGINAFLATHHGSALPPEFSLLRFEPEPWTGADVLVWVKMMAWDLSANYSFELLRDDLIRTVGAERMAELMPPYPVDGLSIMTGPGGEDTNGAVAHAPSPLKPPSRADHAMRFGNSSPEYSINSFSTAGAALLSRTFANALSDGDPAVRDFLLGGAKTEALGSNNWVVDGKLTATGKPLLANDPHLGTRIPSTWYLAHVVGGDFEIMGATLPGAPAVALGRNRSIAWGATNVAADVEDLYREHVDESGQFAEFRGAKEPIAVIPETILVKGRDPIHLQVRVTRHGPLISDAINVNSAESTRKVKPPPLDPLAFRWTALDREDTTVASFLKLNEARNWDQFTAALHDFVAPSQNFVYADVDGHIGYYAPGHIPVRSGGDGSRPADGWTGDAEWTGWIPFDRLPHLYDPPEHVIVTANHRPASSAYPYFLGLEWPEPYRAQRIIDLMHERSIFTPADFARMQADTYSLHARSLLPLLLRHAQPSAPEDREAVTLLRGWNLDATRDSAPAAVFEAWFHQLAPALTGDDLGPLVLDNYQGRFSYVTRFVIDTLSRGDARWCDDRRTDKMETCDETVTTALHAGVADLARRMGPDVKSWRWDRIHQASFPHSGLDAVAALRPFLSRAVPNGGDWSTVNVGPVAADTLYEQHSVPGYREIIDLSPANDSRFLDAVGESGHPLSPHYDDFLHDWQAVRYRKMRMERADIEKAPIGRLTLKFE
jgi:penicillin G amidase